MIPGAYPILGDQIELEAKMYGPYILRWWQLKYFFFTPNPGEMIQFDEHIFQMGWFNQQLDGHFGGIASYKNASSLGW